MSIADVTKALGSVWDDLRERRLWPVALLLLVGVVAVPVLLSKSPAPPPPVPLAASGAPNPAGLAVAALNSSTGPAHGTVRGQGRDPFGGSAGTTPGSASSGASTSPGGSSGSGAGSTTPASTSTTPTGSGSTPGSPASVVSTPAPSGGAPSPPVPAHKPAPAPTGLSDTQSYEIQLSMTNAAGGLDRLNQVPRLTPLPDAQQPLLVELGVLQRAHRVLFAVAPGTVLRGPGRCVPGPIDCEILSLGTDQIESLASSAASSPVSMFAITAVGAVDHPTAAAAQQARQSVSGAGRQFLAKLSLPALTLFQYDPGAGALVDLRNLTVGGS